LEKTKDPLYLRYIASMPTCKASNGVWNSDFNKTLIKGLKKKKEKWRRGLINKIRAEAM